MESQGVIEGHAACPEVNLPGGMSRVRGATCVNSRVIMRIPWDREEQTDVLSDTQDLVTSGSCRLHGTGNLTSRSIFLGEKAGARTGVGRGGTHFLLHFTVLRHFWIKTSGELASCAAC